jgi:Family of unknown function (DUF6056)
MARSLRVLFIAYVALTAIHIGWVIHHEPFGFDAWNMARDTHAEPFTAGRFFTYWAQQFTESNPRIGQPLTYLSYKLEFVAVILTPLAYLVLGWAAVGLGTGRKWSWRNDRDLALYAIALGFMWFALPQIGKTMFCRAYGANYVYGAAIQLAFLVPLRLRARGPWLLFGIAGVIAGACNEHTGPTLCALVLANALWRRDRAAWAAAIGCAIGFALIFFAPGQAHRYDDLAQKASLLGRLLSRGFAGNLDLVREMLLAMAPVLALIGLVAVSDAGEKRRSMWVIAVALVAATLITITIFVSPKLGSRFYIVGCMALLAGLLALIDEVGRGWVPLLALAVLSSVYAATHTIPLYKRLAVESDHRIASLAASRPGSSLTVEAFEQLDDNWWYLGDDFRAQNKRDMIATYFGLTSVVWRAYDSTAPLAVSDVRLVPSEPGIFLDGFRGLALDTIHLAITEALARKPSHGDVEVAVEFVGERPALPRAKILVGRWTRAGLEGWATSIQRAGRATERTIAMPKHIPGDFDVFIYRVGDEAKPLGKSVGVLHYAPWRGGAYWVLACHPTECFVIAAAKQGG